MCRRASFSASGASTKTFPLAICRPISAVTRLIFWERKIPHQKTIKVIATTLSRMEPTIGIEPMTSSFAYTSFSFYKRARLYLFPPPAGGGEPLSVVRALGATVLAFKLLTVIRDSLRNYFCSGRVLRSTMEVLYQLSYVGT